MNNVVTMRALRNHGRFGNNLFTRAFCACYAAEHDCEFQCSTWPGCHLFGIRENPVTVNLPTYYEWYYKSGTHFDDPILIKGNELVNRDFAGYAQIHTSFWTAARRRRWWDETYRPTEDVLTRYNLHPLPKGHTWIGVHSRRTDYGWQSFPFTPSDWYLKWLDANWKRFDSPKLFFASDEPGIIKDFGRYDPVSATDLGANLEAKPLPDTYYLQKDLAEKQPHLMTFYPDFYYLTQCDIIVSGNSTFPFAAAMLNSRLKEYWRSDLKTQTFLKTNPWSAWPLQRDRVEDYPHVEGIGCDSNSYW